MHRVSGLMIILLAASSFAQTSAPQGGSGFMSSILPMMIVMFAVIYFFMIRPEQKKHKEKQNLLSNLKKGDKVLTIGGVYGTIAGVKDDSFMLKISDNTTVRIAKTAVANVIKEKEESEHKSEEEKKA